MLSDWREIEANLEFKLLASSQSEMGETAACRVAFTFQMRELSNLRQHQCDTDSWLKSRVIWMNPRSSCEPCELKKKWPSDSVNSFQKQMHFQFEKISMADVCLNVLPQIFIPVAHGNSEVLACVRRYVL